jgi:adenylate kinase family enzyme
LALLPYSESVRRVAVVGNSGSGKTTVAAAIADALGVPHLELDAVFHQPGWQPLEREVFRARVAEFIAADGWVVDGNYSAVRDLVWARADTVVWLDLPRRQVMRQLTWRTLRRMLTRAELWNGNTEQLRNLLRMDPEQSILRWAWTQHGKYVERYGAAQQDPANQHLAFIRVPDRAAAAALVAGLTAPQAAAAAPGDHCGPGDQPAVGGTAGE